MKVAHLGDIHIKDSRREEYAAVMTNLYEALRAAAPALIVVAGDVYDNKMHASAHNIEDVTNFLTALGAIAPLVLIAGNHDTNVARPGALDLLTPTLRGHAELEQQCTYWRSSGVYTAHGAVWSVKAVDGPFPDAAEEDALWAQHPGAPRVLLFHEEVNGARMPNGRVMERYQLNRADFARYDAAMGGHIHQRQEITPNAYYCGSLVQQNFGEGHNGHGFLLWDIERGTLPAAVGVDVENPLGGFLTVRVENGVDVTATPQPAAVHAWCVESDGAVAPELLAAYTARYGKPPRTVDDGATTSTAEAAPAVTIAAAQAAAREQTTHEEIIRELLATEDADSVEAVIALHRRHVAEWSAAVAQGGRVRLLRLEFDNMYVYGPGNVVDFEALEGRLSGVVARNYSGKSSLIDVILFALYDECPRLSGGNKTSAIRDGESTARVCLEFEADGKRGRIEKRIARGSGAVRGSDYVFLFDGETLAGDKAYVNAEIEKVVGTWPIAAATGFCLQNSKMADFVCATHEKRAGLVADVLSLGRFDQLEALAKEEAAKAAARAQALDAAARGMTETRAAELAAEAAAADAAAQAAAQADHAATERAAVLRGELSAAFREGAVPIAGTVDDVAALRAVAAEAAKHGITPRGDVKRGDVTIPLPPDFAAAGRMRGREGPQTPLMLKRYEQVMAWPHACAALPCPSIEEFDAAAKLLSAQKPRCSQSTMKLADAQAALAQAKAAYDALRGLDVDVAALTAEVAALEAELAASTPMDITSARAAAAGHELGSRDVVAAQAAYEQAAARRGYAARALEVASCRHDCDACQATQAKLRELAACECADHTRDAAARLKIARALQALDAASRRAALEATLHEKRETLQRLEATAARQAAARDAYLAAEAALDEAAAAVLCAARAHAPAEAPVAAERAAAEEAKRSRAALVAAEAARDTARAAAARARACAESLPEAAAARRAAAVWRLYRRVVDKTGIRSRLLEMARARLTEEVGRVLAGMNADFTARLTRKYELEILNAGAGEWKPVGTASGCQHFILGLAARVALWRAATAARPDLLVIDEGFGVCDGENRDALATALLLLAARGQAHDTPSLVFLVTHIDDLKMHIDAALEISGERAKLVRNAEPALEPLAAPADVAASASKARVASAARTRAAAQARMAAAGDELYESEEADPPLFPHPHNPAAMVCVACKAVLTQKSRFETHGATKTHREAAARRARQLARA
jgi:DNA repair exonuclease SbcCD ATPase subunit/DNA repair exonuclease SbcCD nuclease subunit